MPAESQKQFVTVPGSMPIEVVRDESGAWWVGDTAVKNGCRVSHNELNLFLEFMGGRWRLAEYTVESVLARNVSWPRGASQTDLRCPSRLAADRSGNIYIAEPDRNVVWKIDHQRVMLPLAGTGVRGFGGDGGPADEALLDSPHGLAVDAFGNVFIADSFNHRIRRVDPSGRISTIAGNGVAGYGGDGGPANKASLRRPSGVAIGAVGEVLVADTGNSRIRRVDTKGRIKTIAGSGIIGFGGDGGPATDAALMWPRNVASDIAGNVFVADIRHFRIRKIDPQGLIRTIAGTGEPGYSGDGGLATEAKLGWLGGLAVDVTGNLYVADRSNFCVRCIDKAGNIRTVAGTPEGILRPSRVIVGESTLSQPEGFAIDLEGNLYVADRSGHQVRRVAPGGSVSAIAGTGTPGYSGDGGPASKALLHRPCDVAADLFGSLYIADSNNNRIRRVDPSGEISTVAGSGRWGHGMDNDLATDTVLDTPERVMAGLRGQGQIYLSGNDSASDVGNARVYRVSGNHIFTEARAGDSRFWPERDRRSESSLDPDRVSAELALGQSCQERYHDLVGRIDVDGVAKTVAIGPRPRRRGRESPPSETLLAPCDIATDGAGALYLADRDGGRVLRINVKGSVTPVAGRTDGLARVPIGGDVEVDLEDAAGITFDLDGNAYFVASKRVWKLDTEGVVRPFAGTGEKGYWGDGGPATDAGLDGPAGLAADADGNVYVTETRNRRVRRISRSGIITTLVGTTASAQSSQQRRNLSDTHLVRPSGLAVDKSGNVLVTDGDDDRIWKIHPSGEVTKMPGTGEDCDEGDGEPSGVAVDVAGNIYVADPAHHRVRKIAPNGSVSTVAGTGEEGYSEDGKLATETKLSEPRGVAVDEAQNLYISDEMSDVILKVNAKGIITTLAGTGEQGFSGDGGPAIHAKLLGPTGLALDKFGNLYVADSGNRRIRYIDPAGIINTFAGTGETSMDALTGPALQAEFRWPSAVAVDSAGCVYVTESMDMWYDDPNWIRKIDRNGVISVIAGTLYWGYAGDGGPVRNALFDHPSGVAFDAEGNMYIADNRNYRVRKIDRAGTVTTLAGFPIRPGYRGDGQASECGLGCPTDVAVGPAGIVYLADFEDCRVRKIDPAGSITTLVDEGTAAKCRPTSVEHVEVLENRLSFDKNDTGVDGTGAESGASERTWLQRAHLLRTRLSMDEYLAQPLGVVPGTGTGGAPSSEKQALPDQESLRPRAGAGPGGTDGGKGSPKANEAGSSLDSGSHDSAKKRPPMRPSSIAVDTDGNAYVADRQNYRVFLIDPAGTVSVLAGTGEPGYSGDGGPAVRARIYAEHIAVDSVGNVFVAGGNRLRRIESSGIITTVAGTGSDRFSGDRGAASAIAISVSGMTVSPSGDLWLTDRENRQIRVLRRCRY